MLAATRMPGSTDKGTAPRVCRTTTETVCACPIARLLGWHAWDTRIATMGRGGSCACATRATRTRTRTARAVPRAPRRIWNAAQILIARTKGARPCACVTTGTRTTITMAHAWSRARRRETFAEGMARVTTAGAGRPVIVIRGIRAMTARLARLAIRTTMGTGAVCLTVTLRTSPVPPTVIATMGVAWRCVLVTRGTRVRGAGHVKMAIKTMTKTARACRTARRQDRYVPVPGLVTILAARPCVFVTRGSRTTTMMVLACRRVRRLGLRARSGRGARTGAASRRARVRAAMRERIVRTVRTGSGGCRARAVRPGRGPSSCT